MSRSNYSEDCDDNWAMIMWRGMVASSIRGKRGQKLLKELAEAMDAMPEKKLTNGQLFERAEYGKQSKRSSE